MVKPLTSNSTTALTGSVRVPGDKSISHRALMLGALAVGESVVHSMFPAIQALISATPWRQCVCPPR